MTIDQLAAAPMSMRSDRSRRARLLLALAGGAWALFTLPLTAAEWSWPWVATVSRLEPWRALIGAVDEPYVVYGALTGLSFLAIGLALLPDLRRAGWGGALLAWAVLAGTIVSPVSYLSTPPGSPLHALWGSEGPLLVVIGLVGVLAAVTARGWPRGARILLGMTLAVLVAGMLAFGYYPHGPLIGLAIEAAALIALAPSHTSSRRMAEPADRL
ncbi:hypothetical protein [Agrococcus beijingensis]|uniref:hypothetical protein n=1 Tax=Agrococcus beijingensis TaxID=3068634 RepID=UPI0027405606|nr:hypothetical protein [Agrococcus sp. REN33]